MKSNILTEKCTGCSACFNACPTKAIKMELNKDGFYVPDVDYDKCVNCNKCVQVCPVMNPEYNNTSTPKCYAFMASDEIRMRSSSGGVFECMSEEIFREHGEVCGVAFGEDFATQHVLVDNINELHKLRGSKYLQSNLGDVFREIKEKLQKNKKILFSGCPCQVAGLNNYLAEMKSNKNLLTVDLICHGIPSVKAFKNYIKDVHGNKKINYIGFKEKQYGWHASMTISFENGEVYNEKCEKDSYFWSYLCGVNKNEVCGNCQYAKIPRQGDITIGDFWGIANYKKELNDGMGTSVVLLNSIKGEEFFNKIISKSKLIEEAPLEAAINGNANLIQSPKLHKSRRQFFKNLGSRKFEELAKWSYATDRYDIGIVGIPTYVNFGGALTYFALYSILKEKGYSVVMISRPKSCGRPPIKQEVVYESSPYPAIDLKNELKDKNAMSELNNLCETFVVGSDQLFNADLYYRFGEMVTLDWVKDNHRKIAYAASFGHSFFWGKEELRAKMAFYMQKFDAFSVREQDGVVLAKEEFGVDATWVLDPVFLCPKENYEELANKALKKSEKAHIFAYILDSTKVTNEILSLCKENFNLDIELYSEMLFYPTEEDKRKEQEKFQFGLSHGKIEERLYSLINSKFIVADSFHGICFAIIFEIPFVAILNENRGATRFYTLLEKFGFLDRLAKNMVDAKNILKCEIDFAYSKKVLEAEKNRCIHWLLEAINPTVEVKKAYSSEDIINEKLMSMQKMDIKINKKIHALMNGVMFNTVSKLEKYLDMVNLHKEQLLVLISVKDTPGFELNDSIDKKLRLLGCQKSLVNMHWKSYIFVMDEAKIISEVISKNEERVAFQGVISGRDYKVVSRSYNKGNIAAIQIDGIEYSENSRGLNVVLIDKNLNEVIDSVSFDTHIKGFPCKREGKVYNTITSLKKEIEFNNKEKVIDVTPKPGIDKNNEAILHNGMVVSALGGCTLDYFIDKKIKQIIIYGTDLIAAFLWEQAFYKNIEIVKLIGNKECDLEIRFPRVGKVHIDSIVLNEMYDIDIPIVVAGASLPEELIELKKRGKSVTLFTELNFYSHIKNALIEPLLNYKKQYKDLKLAILCTTSINEIENQTKQEKLIQAGDIQKHRIEIYNSVFYSNNYSQEYIKQVTTPIEVYKKSNVDFLCDRKNDYVNISNGYRVTTDVPEEFTNTIYMFGNSVCYGFGTHDEYTIGSVLQRELNCLYVDKSPYIVLNCSNGGGLNAIQQWKSFQYHMPQNGDIAVFVMNNFGRLIKEVYENQFIWCEGKEVLNRPHDMGEIWFDMNHVNAKGYEACGKLLAKKLKNENALISKEGLKNINNENSLPTINLELDDLEKEQLADYIEMISKNMSSEYTGGKIGSIVMNCNPFTLGHRYLIESSAKQCSKLYIFVVEEDRSVFSFQDRIELVREGTKDLNNVIVLPSGKFIISQITFQAYFLKEEQKDVIIDPSEDIMIFASQIAPALGITVRFAGEEPFDPITNQYNSEMKRLLPKFNIEFQVIKRKEIGDFPISASRVRKFLKEQNFNEIKKMVPETTYNYLEEKFINKKNVLVLSGTRFMGIRLVEKLVDMNYDVTIATRGITKDNFGDNIKRIQLERSDEKSVKDALKGQYYDIIFDTTAYSSNSVKYVLSIVECSRYIQVSSVAVYSGHKIGLKEEMFDSSEEAFELSDRDKDYRTTKRNAECCALQLFPHISSAIVRIPFVVEPQNLDNKDLNMRLFFYAEHIVNQIPMNVDNYDYCCSFVRTFEEADFLIYLSETSYQGTINFSSEGYITVREIINYIETKSGVMAIYDENGDKHPFVKSNYGAIGYSFDLEKSRQIKYKASELKDWIYRLLDEYIQLLRSNEAR